MHCYYDSSSNVRWMCWSASGTRVPPSFSFSFLSGKWKEKEYLRLRALEHIVIKASQVCVYSLAAGVTLIGSLFPPQVTQPVALLFIYLFIFSLRQPLILCLNTLLFAFAASLARSMTLFFSRPQAHTNMLTHTHTHTHTGFIPPGGDLS